VRVGGKELDYTHGAFGNWQQIWIPIKMNTTIFFSTAPMQIRDDRLLLANPDCITAFQLTFMSIRWPPVYAISIQNA